MNIGVLDIIAFSNDNKIYSKLIQPALSSIYPQVISAYLKRLGHNVWYYPYMGFEDLKRDLNFDLDIIFISSYTMNSYLAYALSSLYKKQGITTILGGPHARSYSLDSSLYFDYIIGLCDFDLISYIIKQGKKKKELPGDILTNEKQPSYLPSLEERWPFIQKIHKKSSILFPYNVPLISSTGCPNSCEFCTDSTIPYKSFPKELIKNDLLFLKSRKRRYSIIWHDPNFGIRFDDHLSLIEEVNAKNLVFACEMNLSKLTEENSKRLQKNKFWGIAPGLESWSSFNNKTLQNSFKSQTDKVDKISNQLNMVSNYIPIIQANIIFGLDQDTKNNLYDSFYLTKRFIEKTPSVYANFQILTIFGDSTPLYKKYIKDDRIISLPYIFMDGYSISNIKLKCNLSLFYKYFGELVDFNQSYIISSKRIKSCKSIYGKIFYLLKSFSGRVHSNHYKELSKKIAINIDYSSFFNGITKKVPLPLKDKVYKSLGVFKQYLNLKE